MNFVVTVFWMVGITSALNATDNMDGLAGGISFVAACMFAFVGIQTQQLGFSAISAVLAGSVLGFLAFNRPPARIFLGDSGSFFLGYALGAIGVMGAWSTHPVKASLVPILILSVPLVDLGYVVLARRIMGTTKGLIQSIVYCGQDHFSHRLVRIGFTRGQAVTFMLVLSLAVGVLAIALRNSHPAEAALLALQVVLVYVLVFALMRKAGAHDV